MNFFVDEFTWSYSRIQAYETCKNMFYLNYIKEQKKNKVDNFFAQFGKYSHQILELYAQKKISILDLKKYYIKNYKKFIKIKVPPNKYVDLNKKYFNQGLEYFGDFAGYDNYKIVGVEENIYFNIEKYKFRAIVDLIVKDKNDNIIIIDHKTKGKMSKKDKEKMLYQLYLYAMAIYSKYGEYPKKLTFNMCRMNEVFEEEFKIEKIDEVKDWVINSIQKIKSESEWTAKPNWFFCSFICDQRRNCRDFNNMMNT